MTAACSFNRALRAFYKATNLHTHTLSIMGKVFFFPWRSKQSFFTLFSSSQFYFNLALDVLPQTAHVYFYSRKQVHTHSPALAGKIVHSGLHRGQTGGTFARGCSFVFWPPKICRKSVQKRRDSDLQRVTAGPSRRSLIGLRCHQGESDPT